MDKFLNMHKFCFCLNGKVLFRVHVFIGDTEPQIQNIVQDLRNYDPELVLKQVIPDIVKQGQNLMKNKKITVEQFSGMMKTVFQMKEQVMMHQAEKRHKAKILQYFNYQN